MRIRLIAISVLSCCLSWTLHGQNDPVEAKAKLSKWVETRQIISKEKTDWDIEREFLLSSQEILRDQASALKENVKDLKESNTVADDERNALLLERIELQKSEAALVDQITQMEAEIKRMVTLFPEPLQDKLESLIVRIPENPETTKLALGQRLLNILGILSQAEKFNSTANFIAETRDIGGKQIQVLTLYWGLSYAIYADSQGKLAGFGVPSENGWVWSERNDIAPDAKRFLDMYEGNIDIIEFVELPVSIQ